MSSKQRLTDETAEWLQGTAQRLEQADHNLRVSVGGPAATRDQVGISAEIYLERLCQHRYAVDQALREYPQAKNYEDRRDDEPSGA